MRSWTELVALSRDFARYLQGRDYFRQSQPLGAYFRDNRCYYNDLRGKADWKGACSDGVPVVNVPALKIDVVFPITVLLYGLGSLDRYLLDGSSQDLLNVRRCVDWLLSGLLPSGRFDNKMTLFDPGSEYYSDNSCMTNGLAMSFALRVLNCDLPEESARSRLGEAVERIIDNTLTPVHLGGTVLEICDGVALMERCRKDGNIVLNGWIYGVFGLWDVRRYMQHDAASRILEQTLATMKRMLPRFYLRNGWTRYDLAGRTSSPFYHRVHCALLDALYRLTGETIFQQYLLTGLAADNYLLRCRYTCKKILDRLLDRTYHSSTRGS